MYFLNRNILFYGIDVVLAATGVAVMSLWYTEILHLTSITKDELVARTLVGQQFCFLNMKEDIWCNELMFCVMV